MHVKNVRRRKKKCLKDPVLIDTDGQIDSFWGLVLAKRYLDVKAVTVCGGKNNNPEDAFKNVPGFVKMAGLSCGVSKGSERCVLKKKKPAQTHFLPDGKCGLPFPKGQPMDEIPAWDRIYKEAKEAEGNLVVLCYGPMTNLALAIFKYPDICELIKKSGICRWKL